jgi:nicotinate-nucleotide--dimethylbenzimidazole phosphoribosyltransferase
MTPSMNQSALPFDDIRDLIAIMPPALEAAASADPTETLELGRVGEFARFVRSWRGDRAIERPLVALFVGSHGDAPERTKAEGRARMQAISAGTAPVAKICRTADVALRLFELALDHPTGDIARQAAFDEAACAATIAYGMEAIAGGADILAIGAAGDGADLGAAAICFALFGGDPESWVAGAAGENDFGGTARRLAAVGERIGSTKDPLEILRSAGGREIAAMVGAILAARMERTPVILDGLAAVAAGAALFCLDASALDHCVAAQSPATGALHRVCGRLGKAPLFDLGVDERENCGAALATVFLKTASAAI